MKTNIIYYVSTISLFHSVGYINHTVKYTNHTVGYKSQSVKQRNYQAKEKDSYLSRKLCGTVFPQKRPQAAQPPEALSYKSKQEYF